MSPASRGGRLTIDALAGGRRSGAVAIGLAERLDDRRSIGLLLAPILLIGVLLSSGSAMRPAMQPIGDWLGLRAPAPIARRLPDEVTAAAVDVTRLPAALRPEVIAPALDIAALPLPLGREMTVASLDIGALPRPLPGEVVLTSLDVAALPRPIPPEQTLGTLDVRLLPLPLAPETATAGLDLSLVPLPSQAAEVTTAALDIGALPAPPAVRPRGFLMGPRPSRPSHPESATPVALAPPGSPAEPSPFATCRPSEAVLAALAGESPAHRTVPPVDTAAFGEALAESALKQTRELVIYDARYTRIGYPMGDVAPMYGVCTDVVVRAYRALGFDLQEMVQKAKAGRGDPSIDHRRTDVLRRYLAMKGASLAITDLPEDYRPGDIVTYYRPFNRSSVAHIAVVSNVIAPSGRPMIVHNRGWGPQLEDALFADQITGHYRFNPAAPANVVASSAAAPAAPKVVRRPLCPAGSAVASEATVAQFCVTVGAATAAPSRPAPRPATRMASARRG